MLMIDKGGTSGRFDPTVLANGSYFVRINVAAHSLKNSVGIRRQLVSVIYKFDSTPAARGFANSAGKSYLAILPWRGRIARL